MMSRATIDAIKERNPIATVVAAAGVVVKGHGTRRYGQCFCDPQKGKAPLWINTETQTWGCFASGSSCGGDVFAFFEKKRGWDWVTAIQNLVFDGERIDDPQQAARLEAERKERAAENARRNAALDLKEREKAYAMWRLGGPTAGTLADAYFAHRGLAAPASTVLRFSPAEPYWYVPADADARPIVVHGGPCLLAAIQGPDGRFLGLHRTWLDPRLTDGTCPADASGKAAILAPDGTPLNAKKMRGAKQGGAIRLHDAPDDGGFRVFLAGEGIETVETVYQAAIRRGTPGIAYGAWAAGDLGNLAGGGLGGSTRHPTRAGRWVPSREPDPRAPGLMPPPWADHAVLLGDGDSDPHVTGARLACAQARWIAAGVPTTIVMADPGLDFNDMARANRAARSNGQDGVAA